VAILLLGKSTETAITGMALTTVIIGLLLHARMVLTFGYQAAIDWSLLKKQLAFSLPLLPVGFSQWALQGLDNFFIDAILGKASVGIYSVAYMIASITLALTVASNYVWYPTLVRL